jgi:hypothetical protein
VQEVTADWRRQQCEELYCLYCSPSIIRVIKLKMGWAGHAARIVEWRNAYMLLMWKPEGKRPLGRHKCRRRGNIKMNLKGVGWTPASAVKNFSVP